MANRAGSPVDSRLRGNDLKFPGQESKLAVQLNDSIEPIVAKPAVAVESFHDLAKLSELRIEFFVGRFFQRVVFAPMTSAVE